MNRILFIVFVVVGIFIRFIHFGEQLDEPHVWRQSDTAHYIHDFHENGIDLLEPAACWMGNYEALVLEFPLPEAIAAVGYSLFGEHHVVARVVFFLFYLGSLFFFYKIVEELSGKKLAQLASVVYLFAPLSLFYSRAIHIDFSALFFAHGAASLFIRAYRYERWTPMLFGSIMAALAMVIKAPYFFYFAIPLGYLIVKEKHYKFFLKSSFLLLLPMASFLAWRYHAELVNGSAPNWEFVPGYRKFVANDHWYYGNMEQRADINNWLLVLSRIHLEILGWIGLAFCAVGIVWMFIKKQLFYLLWLTGTIVYLSIFFNLNIVHNYYQAPFIAIGSVLVAGGIVFVSERLKKWSVVVSLVIIVGVACESFIYAESNYYELPVVPMEIGKVIRENTKPDDLIMINYANTDNKCPVYLYQAKRRGWHILDYKIHPNIVYELMKEGATHFITIRSKQMEGTMQEFLKVFPLKTTPLKATGQNVFVYDLHVSRIWADLPADEKLQFVEKGLMP